MSCSKRLLLFALLIIGCAMKSNISNYGIELATKKQNIIIVSKKNMDITQINLVIMLIGKLKDLML
ncbi:uncharacterized protein METZ01_LOCUS278394 [marine metagenome]|uniref:Lipoprotein n=1 Tax=marine metagenome TaxID=408172 RepID=A0A382KM33_9ZZZZ